MAGAASMPNARLLLATIDATTSSTAEVKAMVIDVSTTIAVATTAAHPMECQSATVANARLAMGIALATISLEKGNPRLAAKKDGKGKGSPCEMHSYSGRPAKHEWAECSESPANQKKSAAEACGSILCSRQASPCE